MHRWAILVDCLIFYQRVIPHTFCLFRFLVISARTFLMKIAIYITISLSYFQFSLYSYPILSSAYLFSVELHLSFFLLSLSFSLTLTSYYYLFFLILPFFHKFLTYLPLRFFYIHKYIYRMDTKMYFKKVQKNNNLILLNIYI